MKLAIFTILFMFAFDESFGLKCKSDPDCLTLDDMGAGWGGYFKDQANAPCLVNVVGPDPWCFNSKGGSLKPCSCWDDTLTFDNKWCNPGLYGEGNTMCKYKAGAQPSCGDVKITGVSSQAVKDAIVDKHNELRAKVANGKEKRGVNGRQPKASNMRKLVWNDELAEVAQRWVDQCTNGHDKNRRTEEFSHVGQNWAWQGSWKIDDQAELAPIMVERWYDEVKDMTTKALKAYSSNKAETGATGVIGHYTQVVWADTAEVGCGYMTSDKNGSIESVLVCNYGPGGNYLGSPVYKTGKPGSKCPSDTKKTAEGLCA